MKVFLSWSGERSQLVASALRDWLPLVINEVSPFVSSDDIHAGARWLTTVTAELEGTDFGILCVTIENQQMSWLNFEAGALAKAVNTSRVIPLAINLRPAEIQNPLGQFQSQPLTHAGMSKIVSSLNSALSKPLAPSLIEKATTKWWPDLEKGIQEINRKIDLSDGVEKAPRSSDRELLEDILNSVRSLARTATPLYGSWEAPDHQTVTAEPPHRTTESDLVAALRRSMGSVFGGRSGGFVAQENAAEQQLITELYTRAVDQLDAGRAPVRLGGLHALERLAQNNPVQRQTIVDVICAYLRIPYTPPRVINRRVRTPPRTRTAATSNAARNSKCG